MENNFGSFSYRDACFVNSTSVVLFMKQIFSIAAVVTLIAVLVGCHAKKTPKAPNAPDALSKAIRVEKKTYNKNWYYIPNLRDVGPGLDKESNTKQVVNLLTNRIIDYYGLSEKYNTPLKGKVFLDSPEGKELSNKFQKLYDETVTKEFYYYYDFDAKRTKYNLNTRRMDTDFFWDEYTERQISKGYIAFHGGLLLSLPKAISYFTYSGNLKRLSIPIKSETIALEIEENSKDYALLFVFNLKGASQAYSFVLPDRVWGKTKQAYIVNKKTGTIYSDIFK